MTWIPDQIRRRRDLVLAFVPSMIGAARRNRVISDPEAFCFFVGHPRSGHSLVGALLDAHPDAVIAHELHALRLVRAGYRRDQIYWLLTRNARRFAARGAASGEYSYTVPGQWQGQPRGVRVIGDKKAGATTIELMTHPDTLERLRDLVDVPIRVVHVVRNPYDNIATMSRRSGDGLAAAAERYFWLCDGIMSVTRQLRPGEMFEFSHEDLLQDPDTWLSAVSGFLGLLPADDYLAACRELIKPTPRRSSRSVAWPAELVGDVETRIGAYPFLIPYGGRPPTPAGSTG